MDRVFEADPISLDIGTKSEEQHLSCDTTSLVSTAALPPSFTRRLQTQDILMFVGSWSNRPVIPIMQDF